MADYVEKEDHEAGDDDNEPVPEEESTATFTPVVRLEQVEVKTFEEDEDVLYKQRGKLFIFGETLLDKGTGNKTWKERGVGDFKLLKHKENGRIRALMRQEKTMKIIVNHFVDPRITLTPNVGNDKSWVWVAFDYADNELIETTFAIRFASAEIAQEFKKEFTKAQEEMKSLVAGLDSKEGSKEADEAAKAVESLSVGEKSIEGEAPKENP
eukprot:gene2853-3037_t